MNEHRFKTGPRGIDLRLCEWGAGPTTTLILHGFLEQGQAWNAVAEQLTGRIIAPDHRGHGLSAHAGPGGFYHFFDYVADVDAIIASINTPVRLVGHSMGGTIACYYAGSRPEKISSLVLIEGLGPPDHSNDPVGVARRHLNDRLNPRQHPAFDTIEDAAGRMRRINTTMTKELALSLAQNLIQPAPDSRLTWSWDTLHRARNPRPFEAKIFKKFLAEITCPTLVIRGADSTFSPTDYPERQACLQNAEELVISDAGHMVHHDQPVVLAQALATFFNAHSR